jgi:hypothetical protein
MLKVENKIISAIASGDQNSLKTVLGGFRCFMPLHFTRVSPIERSEIYNEHYCWHVDTDPLTLFQCEKTMEVISYENIISQNTGNGLPCMIISNYVKDKNALIAGIERLQINYDDSPHYGDLNDEDLNELIQAHRFLLYNKNMTSVSFINVVRNIVLPKKNKE